MNLLDKIAYDTGGYTVQEILSSFCKKIIEIIDLVNKNEEVCDESRTIIENIRNEVVPGLVEDMIHEMQDSGYFDSLVNVTLIEQLRTELTTLLNQTVTDYTTRLDNFDSQLDNINNKLKDFFITDDEFYIENGDNTKALQNLIIKAINNNGGRIVINKPIKIYDTIYFYGGNGTTYDNNTSITLDCNKNLINSYLTEGNVFQLGKLIEGEYNYPKYKILINDLVLNANRGNVQVFNGDPFNKINSGTSQNNTIIELNNSYIYGFSGDNSVGINGGLMTDCKFNNVRINGDGGKIGVKFFRENNQLFNCDIAYCEHGVFVPNFGEANIKMIGGNIMACTNMITFEGGGYLLPNSFFKGTYIAEAREGNNIINVINTDNFNVDTLTFDGCILGVYNPLDKCILNLSKVNGIVNVVNCTLISNSTHKNIKIGQYTTLNLKGNSGTLTVDESYFNNNINPFNYTQVLLNVNVQGATYSGGAASPTKFIIPFDVKCLLAISGVSDTNTQKESTIQLIKNGQYLSNIEVTNLKTGNVNNIGHLKTSFKKGDIITFHEYFTGDNIDHNINLTLQCLV